MSPKYAPEGLGMMIDPIPDELLGPGLDAWANPNRSFTPNDCAGVTSNCCTTNCRVEQDTVHKDTRPEQWCACNIEDIDHGEPNNDKKKEIECSGIASTVTGMGSGNALVSTTIKETWEYDEPGRRNWAVHKYNKFNSSNVPQWDQRGFYERTMTFNQADQPTHETITRSVFENNNWHAAAVPESYDIKFDKRGNLWSDGRKAYLYDAYNRLTQVREFVGLSGNVPLLTGDPIAAFTYDGYGHRLTARYNTNDNGTLDDDSVDVYSYDHLWRIRTVTEATHTQTGWTSFVREQWFYHTGDDPYGYKLGSDAPVMRRIDADGDGIFDETQNFVTDRQGSVVGVLGAAVPVDVNNEAAGMKPGEVIARVRYDTYGVPTICDPADIDRDGVVDLADVALYCTYWNAWHANGPNTARYKEILDYNRDGVVDPDDPCGTSNNADFAALTTRAALVINELVPDVKEAVGNLPLYAGYWWDAQLEMYHVRHRVYRPEWGKWIQRDPLGYAAGWNLYEYVVGSRGGVWIRAGCWCSATGPESVSMARRTAGSMLAI